ncbi:MAG: HAD hydrolase-like protein [Clostridiales bacterium]|jgi:phosphoglycolate phosphatase|nr:HAD hydrolase-like protein [Clostridiales bacterium]
MKPAYDLILFDLDGTLTDSEPGITSCVKYSLEKMGLPVPSQQVLRKFIGPPLYYGYVNFCGMTPEQAEKASVYYREVYHKTGAFQNTPYPGIMELLEELKSAGATMAVATSKPDPIAYRVLDYFKLSPYFNYIACPNESEHSGEKYVLLESCLKHCGVKAENAVMIGDTHFDIEGAQRAGTHFIGVLYGFGTKEEMEEKGGKLFARNLAELKNLLLIPD